MNKLIALSLATATALALEGCASTSSVRVTEIDAYQHSQLSNIRSFGGANMQTLGPVLIKTEDRCSVSDVARAAINKYKNVSDIIHIRMEETSRQTGATTTYSCKSYALAVNYKSVSAEEFQAWKDFVNSDSTHVPPHPPKKLVPTNPTEPENTTEATPEEEPTDTAEAVEDTTNTFYTR